VSASFPKTEKRLRDAGILTRAVALSELEKAEGGLTCLWLLVEREQTSSEKYTTRAKDRG